MADEDRKRQDEDEKQELVGEEQAPAEDDEPDFELHGQFFEAPSK